MKGEVVNKSRQRRNDCAVQTGSLHHQGINVSIYLKSWSYNSSFLLGVVVGMYECTSPYSIAPVIHPVNVITNEMMN